MAFDEAGNFLRQAGTRISNGGPLVSQQVNDETDNLVLGLNGKVNLDGKLALTGLQLLSGDGTNALHAATVQQAQKDILKQAVTVSGTVDALQVTFTPATTTWTLNEKIRWASIGANATSTPTISKNGGTTNITIVKGAGIALVGGDIGAAGTIHEAVYNGTNVVLLNPATLSVNGKSLNLAKGAAVVSAATTDIWTPADGNYRHITGTTTITSFGTAPQAGAEQVLVFDGALTLTYNTTSLILPGAASITTAAGDTCIVKADTTANMIVTSYTRASGQAVIAPLSTPVLLNTLTASNSASLSDTTSFTSAYRYYKVTIENLVPVNNGVGLFCQPQISAVFQASGSTVGIFNDSGGTGGFSAANTNLLNNTNISNLAGGGVSGDILVSNPASTTNYKILRSSISAVNVNGPNAISNCVSSFYYFGSTAAMTGIQFTASSGNLSTGIIKIYGWN